jgi:NAD(P)H dehydrogenase (quinone)
MGKVLILYDSASGKTAKMANLVSVGAAAIPGTEVRMRHIQ